MPEAEWAQSVKWMYTVLVDKARFGLDSRELLRELDQRGIQARPLWQPLHLSGAHRGAASTDCSAAERLNRQALSLPCSVGLDCISQQRVIETLGEIHRKMNR